MPDGLSFYDKGREKRTEMRIKCWEDPAKMTYNSISVHSIKSLPKRNVDISSKNTDYYKEDDKLVFFGHYWLKDETPSLFKDNICCLDYSVAKNGYLVAYSLDDESILDLQKFTHTNTD